MENTQTATPAFDLKSVPFYLEKLTAETKPAWGIMTPQHMLEHLGNTLVMVNSKKALPCVTPEEHLPAYRQFLMSEKPFAQNIPNQFIGDGLAPLRFEDLETAKTKLLAAIESFQRFFQENPEATPMHPFFGHLNYEEWQQFQRKHFTHHFRQFGLIG
ncbi:DUF1569 domain-containing protein [Adhaeribacter soli]|uniref:DUF1569 domain-containing protein n=1 Tax=Adhaeribacter soli TaxID=2607655 RepID=A0A5N1IU74_9BACT|nr:DUF1569 domain-containing protein [Adhaeribacter soli]KAA9333570.1 DUF1569 domain-containing protein [Adhaeribacter soli]